MILDFIPESRQVVTTQLCGDCAFYISDFCDAYVKHLVNSLDGPSTFKIEEDVLMSHLSGLLFEFENMWGISVRTAFVVAIIGSSLAPDKSIEENNMTKLPDDIVLENLNLNTLDPQNQIIEDFDMLFEKAQEHVRKTLESKNLEYYENQDLPSERSRWKKSEVQQTIKSTTKISKSRSADRDKQNRLRPPVSENTPEPRTTVIPTLYLNKTKSNPNLLEPNFSPINISPGSESQREETNIPVRPKYFLQRNYIMKRERALEDNEL